MARCGDIRSCSRGDLTRDYRIVARAAGPDYNLYIYIYLLQRPVSSYRICPGICGGGSVSLGYYCIGEGTDGRICRASGRGQRCCSDDAVYTADVIFDGCILLRDASRLVSCSDTVMRSVVN